jgi:hypothetical protein
LYVNFSTFSPHKHHKKKSSGHEQGAKSANSKCNGNVAKPLLTKQRMPAKSKLQQQRSRTGSDERELDENSSNACLLTKLLLLAKLLQQRSRTGSDERELDENQSNACLLTKLLLLAKLQQQRSRTGSDERELAERQAV